MQWIAAAEEIETFMQIWYKVFDAYTIFVLQRLSTVNKAKGYVETEEVWQIIPAQQCSKSI